MTELETTIVNALDDILPDDLIKLVILTLTDNVWEYEVRMCEDNLMNKIKEYLITDDFRQQSSFELLIQYLDWYDPKYKDHPLFGYELQGNYIYSAIPNDMYSDEYVNDIKSVIETFIEIVNCTIDIASDETTIVYYLSKLSPHYDFDIPHLMLDLYEVIPDASYDSVYPIVDYITNMSGYDEIHNMSNDYMKTLEKNIVVPQFKTHLQIQWVLKYLNNYDKMRLNGCLYSQFWNDVSCITADTNVQLSKEYIQHTTEVVKKLLCNHQSIKCKVTDGFGTRYHIKFSWEGL